MNKIPIVDILLLEILTKRTYTLANGEFTTYFDQLLKSSN